MVRLSLLLFVSFILASCQKDASIDQPAIDPLNLADCLASQADERTFEDAFAFAGNHTRFERSTDALPIHIYAVIPARAQHVRFYETDSLRYRDSLPAYQERAIDAVRLGDGRMLRFARKDTRTDRYCRVSYLLHDTLHYSPSIAMRAATLESNDLNTITSFHDEQGYYAIDWNSFPGTDQYLLVLKDAQGDIRVAVTTSRTRFQCFDLRSVEQNFTSDLRDPQLVEGARYTMQLYAITSRNWLVAVGEHAFSYSAP